MCTNAYTLAYMHTHTKGGGCAQCYPQRFLKMREYF